MDPLKIIRLAFSVISDRLIAVLSLCMACGLSCWSMWGPSWERIATLAIFVLFAYLVARVPKEKQHGHSETEM
jgi:hypothetical protein